MHITDLPSEIIAYILRMIPNPWIAAFTCKHFYYTAIDWNVDITYCLKEIYKIRELYDKNTNLKLLFPLRNTYFKEVENYLPCYIQKRHIWFFNLLREKDLHEGRRPYQLYSSNKNNGIDHCIINEHIECVKKISNYKYNNDRNINTCVKANTNWLELAIEKRCSFEMFKTILELRGTHNLPEQLLFLAIMYNRYDISTYIISIHYKSIKLFHRLLCYTHDEECAEYIKYLIVNDWPIDFNTYIYALSHSVSILKIICSRKPRQWTHKLILSAINKNKTEHLIYILNHKCPVKNKNKKMVYNNLSKYLARNSIEWREEWNYYKID